MSEFRAIVLRKVDGQVQAAIEWLSRDALPAGEVLVSVDYSSLNYKDGLAVTGSPGVVRCYPMIPGIDLAGTVVESSTPAFQPGDSVVMTGCGAGDRHWGGYAQMARVQADWLVPLPAGMSLKQAMGIGTAGFTAMQCVMRLEEMGMTPNGREILVTGAAGGVGSVAVCLLSRLGYRVVASTGRPELHAYLLGLGAESIIDRRVLSTSTAKGLESERWGGAIDSVGGETLASLLKQLAYGSSVAACGVAGGAAVPTTVFPFILRGVNLLGIDAAQASPATRRRVWQRLARDLPRDKLDQLIQTASLDDVFSLSPRILRGEIRGRTVIDLRAEKALL